MQADALVLHSTRHTEMNFPLTGKREREEFLWTVEHKELKQRKLDVHIAILAPCGTVYGH